MHTKQNFKQISETVCGEKRAEQKSCFVKKIIGNVCSESAELALAKWVKIIEELECQIGCTGLLACPDFDIFKGFETSFHIL